MAVNPEAVETVDPQDSPLLGLKIQIDHKEAHSYQPGTFFRTVFVSMAVMAVVTVMRAQYIYIYIYIYIHIYIYIYCILYTCFFQIFHRLQ